MDILISTTLGEGDVSMSEILGRVCEEVYAQISTAFHFDPNHLNPTNLLIPQNSYQQKVFYP